MDMFDSQFISPHSQAELAQMRRRFAVLEKKIECGEFAPFEDLEFEALKEALLRRESEERAKWDKCFKK
jgi:hypothetical protein